MVKINLKSIFIASSQSAKKQSRIIPTATQTAKSLTAFSILSQYQSDRIQMLLAMILANAKSSGVVTFILL
jgi:hypothetical protein